MKNTSATEIESLILAHRDYFATHETKSLNIRLDNLIKFKKNILQYEQLITDALWQDLHKSAEEAYLTEISIVLQEIDNHIKHLKKWTKAKKCPLLYIYYPRRAKFYMSRWGWHSLLLPGIIPFNC